MTASLARPSPIHLSDLKPISRWLLGAGLLAAMGLQSPSVLAQAALPGQVLQPAPASLQAEQLDPPASIARLGLAEGSVSYLSAEDTGTGNWSAANLNRPLVAGDRLWTGPQSRAELHAGSTAIRLSGQTDLDLAALDDNNTRLQLSRGSIRLRVRQLFSGQRLEVNTPNLAFVITQPGDYRVDADPAVNTSRVVAQSGGGVLYGDSGASVPLAGGQQGNFASTNLSPAAPGPSVTDSFDYWAMARDQLEDQSISARYIPRETVGYQQLDRYGDWQQDPTYGAVWLPRAVPSNWAPYRVGHWSWIAPWGWTWVDDAPWGFAPFHYGRWAQIGPRWAWVPGRLAPRPVYAPALVAFLGGSSGGVNWSVNIGSGPARPGLGWFPLAPGEAFRPAYRVSPRYVTRVNNNIVVQNTVNVTNVYRYQRTPAAVTAVSAGDFAAGRPVRPVAALSPADIARAPLADERRAMPARPQAREAARPAAAAPVAAVPVRAAVLPEARADARHEARGEARDEAAAQAARREPPRLQEAPRAQPAPRDPARDDAITQARRAEQQQRQLQRDQQRQLQEQQRQADQQRRQSEESIGQRALREQAAREREARQQEARQQEARQRQDNANARQAQQRQADEQARRQQVEQRERRDARDQQRAAQRDERQARPPSSEERQPQRRGESGSAREARQDNPAERNRQQ